MPTTDALLTVDEAAAFLRVSRRTVYQLSADGLLRPRVNSSPATVDRGLSTLYIGSAP